jgi:hypothetical protein
MATRSWGRVGAGAALLGLLASCLLGAPAAAAGTTLHYFNRNQTVTATDASGRPLANNGSAAPPAAGDRVDYTALDYVGNHRHHASTASASSHLACTFVDRTTLTCNAQFAVGGLLLLGIDVTATLSSSGISSIPINAGTGKYKNASGMIVVTPIRNSVDADVTIRLNR